MGLRALVAVQLAALLVLGVATVARFPVWALVDEAAHYDYVQWIAEDGRLPVLDEDPVHPEVLAIDEGLYPAAPRVAAEERGLFGRSYEGFQPPLAHLWPRRSTRWRATTSASCGRCARWAWCCSAWRSP